MNKINYLDVLKKVKNNLYSILEFFQQLADKIGSGLLFQFDVYVIIFVCPYNTLTGVRSGQEDILV